MISRNTEPPDHEPARKTSVISIALAWLVVCVPAAWGVSQTVRTSMKLLHPAPPAATQPSADKAR